MKIDKELAKELRNAVNNLSGMNWFVDKGIVCFDVENKYVEVNYLLWHTFSTKGLAKFCHSLYFNMRIKQAASGAVDIDAEPLLICVNYGTEPNEYGKKGIVRMCRYNSTTGFSEV